MNVENTEGESMRPVRRTEKLVVREVGDELVAYALDTEQVTAIDPVTAQVWQRLDGASTLEEIAATTDMADLEVEAAVDRLDRAGLIAGGLDRRRFIRLAAGSAGAATLLAVAAPSAMAAYSNRKFTSLTATSCDTAKKPMQKEAVTVKGLVSGTNFPSGPINLTANVVFVGGTGPAPASFSGTIPVTGPTFTSTPYTVASANRTDTPTSAGWKAQITVSHDIASGVPSVSITATTTGLCS